jgi:hypothetical protein
MIHKEEAKQLTGRILRGEQDKGKSYFELFHWRERHEKHNLPAWLI